MNEVELQRMIVRLVGDSTQFKTMLQDAAQQAQRTAGKIETMGSRIERIQQRILSFSQSAVSALAFVGVSRTLGEAMHRSEDLEIAQMKLEGALKASGDTSGATMQKFKQFAEETNSTTLFTREQTMRLLEQAQTMGYTGDQAIKLAKDAQALGSVLDGGAEAGLRAAMAMKMGNPEMLKFTMHLRGLKNQGQIWQAAQMKLKEGYEIMDKMTKTATGSITMMRKSLDELGLEIGRVVAEAIQPMVMYVRQAVEWFKHLDPAIKKITVGLALLMGVVVGFAPFVGMLQPVIAVISAVAGVLTGPWGIAVVAAVAGIVLLVRHLGGVGAVFRMVQDAGTAAWAYIQQKISDFMDWMQPVWQALSSLAKDAWQIVSSAAQQAWDYITQAAQGMWEAVKDAWARLVGDTRVDWNTIRDTIRDAILFVEFSFHHFKDIVALDLAFAKYAVVAFISKIDWLATVAVPAATKYFYDNWQNLVIQAINNGSYAVENFATNTVRIMQNLPGLIQGTVKWSDVWKPLTEGFQKLVPTFKLPKPVENALEKQLREDFEHQAAALRVSFEEFRNQKLQEFANDAHGAAKSVSAIGSAAKQAGDGIQKYMEKPAQKIQAALAGSAEAVARIAEYRDKLDLMKNPGLGGSDKTIKVESGAAAGGAEARQRVNENTLALRNLTKALEDQAKRPALQPANI